MSSQNSEASQVAETGEGGIAMSERRPVPDGSKATMSRDMACPHGDGPIQYDPALAGVTGQRPTCGKTFQMPETELALLKQIRDNTAFIRFWTYPIVVLLMLVLFFIRLPGIRLPWAH
jgi:hypothetical protein